MNIYTLLKITSLEVRGLWRTIRPLVVIVLLGERCLYSTSKRREKALLDILCAAYTLFLSYLFFLKNVVGV